MTDLTSSAGRSARGARCLVRWLAVAFTWCAVGVAAAHAQVDEPRVIDLRRTTWGPKEGVPEGIGSMAQTTDGYLWLASETGLVRFDGLSFEPYALPGHPRVFSKSIYRLEATPDGGLWISFTFGGLAFLKDGRMTLHAEEDGLPAGSIFTVSKEADGTLWAGGGGGLARLRGTRWEKVGPEHGLKAERIAASLVDSKGTLWVASEKHIHFKSPGEDVFREWGSIQPGNDSTGLLESPTGEVWLFGIKGLTLLRRLGEGTGRPSGRGFGASFSRDGRLWYFSPDGYLHMLEHLRGLEHASWKEAEKTPQHARDPFSVTASFTSVIEDREGNLWGAGTGTLNRYSAPKITRHSLEKSAKRLHRVAEMSIGAGEQGGLWLGTRHSSPFLLGDRKAPPRAAIPSATSLGRGDDGTVLFGASGAFWTLRSGQLERSGFPDGVDDETQAIARTADGAVWVSIVRNGVFRVKDGVWRAQGDVPSLPGLTAITMTTDAGGRLWFGYTEGRVAVLEGRTVRVFADDRQLPIGNVTALYGKRSRIWAGGEFGLAVLDGGAFLPVITDGGAAFNNVTGIVETADGGLWVNASAGIVHLPAAETRRMAQDPRYRPRVQIINALDGFEGTSARLRPLPTAIEGTDGKLWFTTSAGLYSIDPSKAHRNAVPPTVLVQSVTVGDTRVTPRGAVTLPKGTTALRIGYIGISLTMAEKVRYRYELEGVDAGWQDVGGRREALYTELKPGRYRFRVSAANNDGVWNETGATLDLVIPPTFVQTRWFVVLCGIGASLLVWLIVRLRVNQVAARLKVRFDERMAERTRIARELHDTLLQSTQGLILQLQAAVDRLPADEPARADLTEALDRGESVLTEGRDRVLDLRVAADRLGDLPQALAATGAELAQDRPVTFHSAVEGVPRALRPAAEEELYRIGREALLNAFRHACATTIATTISYGERMLVIRIRDDGIGLDAGELEAGMRPDHWGVRGMRERAARVGAALVFHSRPGIGTEIELSLSAALAYAPDRRGRRWLPTSRFREG